MGATLSGVVSPLPRGACCSDFFSCHYSLYFSTCSGRSDAIFRIEASLRKREPQSSGLKPCPDCLFSSYCCEEHWDAVKEKHKQAPCRDGRDNLSQCDMNKLYVEDIRFATVMSGANAGEFKWAPERTLRAWKSLRGVGWSDFVNDVEKRFGGLDGIRPMMAALLRGTTEGLSMPMTILWALENMNSDDEWTKKKTLNIHVRDSVDLHIFTCTQILSSASRSGPERNSKR